MPNTENKALAMMLRAARKQISETQTEFAQRFGVKQSTISRWEETGPRTGPGRLAVEQIIDSIDRVHPINRK